MKKYIANAGYTFRANYDDLTNKQFALVGITYEQSNNSVLRNIILDRIEEYNLFLKDIDAVAFKSKLETIINSAVSGGVNISEFANIEVVKVENGYNVTMIFTIKGE